MDKYLYIALQLLIIPTAVMFVIGVIEIIK